MAVTAKSLANTLLSKMLKLEAALLDVPNLVLDGYDEGRARRAELVAKFLTGEIGIVLEPADPIVSRVVDALPQMDHETGAYAPSDRDAFAAYLLTQSWME